MKSLKSSNLEKYNLSKQTETFKKVKKIKVEKIKEIQELVKS